MSNSASVYVLSGPTAVGKGTVVQQLQALYPQLAVSVSATTRAPRPGEVEGESYFFMTEDQFLELDAAGQLLESAIVHGKHRYGTPRTAVERQLKLGRTVLLEIDLAGARQVRKTLPAAHFIFLAPPSWEELKRRLVGRGTETAEEQERRLVTARAELDAAEEFDVTVINDNLEKAVEQLADLMGLH